MPVPPTLLIVAGSNGAGKSTFAVPYAQKQGLPFLNADELTRQFEAAGESQALIKAARAFLAEVAAYLARGESVCIETTLSGGYVAGVVASAKAAGFRVELFYIFLESADVAVGRVASRVHKGGHDVPEDAIRRRFARSMANFEKLRHEVDLWELYYSSKEGIQLVAKKLDGLELTFISDLRQIFERNLPS